MTITLDPELSAAVAAAAARRGVSPEDAAADALRAQLLPRPPLVPPADWERHIRSLGINCGVVLPPEAMSSEGYYE